MTTSEMTTKELKKQVKELQKSLAFETGRADAAENDVAALQHIVFALEEAESLPPSDGVVFQGKSYDIIMVDTAAEIKDKMQKRFVDADQTVVVINRHGS